MTNRVNNNIVRRKITITHFSGPVMLIVGLVMAEAGTMQHIASRTMRHRYGPVALVIVGAYLIAKLLWDMWSWQAVTYTSDSITYPGKFGTKATTPIAELAVSVTRDGKYRVNKVLTIRGPDNQWQIRFAELNTTDLARFLEYFSVDSEPPL